MLCEGGQLLRVGELALRGDEVGLLRGELGLELRAERYEGLGFGEARFELADVARVVGALGFEDADFGAKFLELLVVWGAGLINGLDGAWS